MDNFAELDISAIAPPLARPAIAPPLARPANGGFRQSERERVGGR